LPNGWAVANPYFVITRRPSAGAEGDLLFQFSETC
jgi:hypothetical protein